MISTLIDNRPDRKFTETRTSYIPEHVNVGAGIITRTNGVLSGLWMVRKEGVSVYYVVGYAVIA